MSEIDITMVSLRESGLSYREIGRLTGYSRSAARRHVLGLLAERREREEGRRTRAAILAYLQSSREIYPTYGRIAAAVGLRHPSTVYHHLRRMELSGLVECRRNGRRVEIRITL
jgi:DNA-binding transcriptional ArsR family regulator